MLKLEAMTKVSVNANPSSLPSPFAVFDPMVDIENQVVPTLAADASARRLL